MKLCRKANPNRNMPVDSLKPLVKALLDQLPDDPTSIVISVKSETESPISPNAQKAPTGPPYDPSHVYLLEFCTVLALRDSETITALGADVAEALMNVMRNAASYHNIMVSRTVFYLLHLLHASYVGFADHFASVHMLIIAGTLFH
jgi:brefeldin A-resistance guanine nucleotide exchange factor 1